MFEAAGLVVVVELVVVVPLLFVVEVVLVVDVVAFELVAMVGEGDAAGRLALALPFAGRLVALFDAASPQAIPKALRAKSDESAITFFITNSSLLSSSKSICNLLSQPEYPVCSYLKVFSEQTTL